MEYLPHNMKSRALMMYSNIFLILPVIFAAIYHEWLYLFLASGLSIFSPLYHWYQICKPTSYLHWLYGLCDVIFAISAFIYMYFYAYMYTDGPYKTILLSLLTAAVLFFWFGRRRDYKRWHPWFHVFAPIISSLILILAH